MTRTTQTLPIETGGADIKNWPDSPRALAGRLRRAATFLRKVGIEIGFGREGRWLWARAEHARPGHNIIRIAKVTNLSRQTIYRIKDDPESAEAALVTWSA